MYIMYIMLYNGGEGEDDYGRRYECNGCSSGIQQIY